MPESRGLVRGCLPHHTPRPCAAPPHAVRRIAVSSQLCSVSNAHRSCLRRCTAQVCSLILAAVTICRGAQSGHTGTLTAEAIAHAINHKEKLECTSTKGITRTLDVVTDEMFVEAPKPSCSATGCWFPQKIKPTRLRDAAGNMCTSRDSGKLIGDQFPESMSAKIMEGDTHDKNGLLDGPILQVCLAMSISKTSKPTALDPVTRVPDVNAPPSGHGPPGRRRLTYSLLGSDPTQARTD